MIIYFYSFIPLLFLQTDSSSIRDRNFRNDLVPLLSSRLDSSKKDANSMKIVSNEPFIIQLQMPNSGESARKASKEKDKKRKRTIKKRVSKLKPLRKRHRQRRDLQSPKIGLDTEGKSDRLEMLHTGKIAEHQSENGTRNAISRADVLKALSSFTTKREAKTGKKDVKNSQEDEEEGNKMEKYVSNKTPDGNVQRLSPSPLVKMVYPSTPKTDKNLHKYSYKDMMSDRERLEKKIKYIRNMMNLSIADDAVRVRRRSESDRTANKIAKMFLTLSAVNGLHDRLKSKCDDDDDNDEDSRSFWEKEDTENSSKRSSSSNEERYKVKKWIEHMKNKRSSSKTCPCMAKERDEESDVFPLEQKLPRNYYLLQKGGGSEESSEAYEGSSHFHRDKPNKSSHNRRRHHKAREDQENKLKALAGKGRKLELPLDDLELYRLKAKQILQNAEEILDKIKEEEEKRLSAPNILMNQLKELTSRIQTDPRNNENELIRKIQKTLDLGLASKSSDGADGHTFLENVKSFILDPYEKAKALTDESAKKLSTYLLRNLGELQEPHEIKEDADDKGNLRVYFGQVPQKEEEKPHPASLAKENADEYQSKSKESLQNWTDTVSSLLPGSDENKKMEDWRGHPEEQLEKRMEEIIKEQEKKLNGYEATQESEESSKELADNRVGNRKEERGENETVESEETLEEIERAPPLQQKKDEIINNHDSTENDRTKKDKSETPRDNKSKESDYVSEREVSEGAGENGKESKRLKEGEAEQEVLKEILREFDENKEPVESEVAVGYKEPSFKEGEKEANGADEEDAPVELVHEKSNDQEEMPEMVAAVTPEEKETSLKDGSRGSDEIPRYGTDEEIEAKKPEQSKEGKSDGETVLEEQEEPKTESNLEIHSAGSFNKTPDLSSDTEETVGLNDPALNNGDELREKTDQNTQRERESQTAMEDPDLLKEVKPDESSEKMKSNEEKDEAEAGENEKEETLHLETPAEGHTQEENDSGKENVYDDTLGNDQLLKAVVDNEDQEGLSGATLDGENSYEGFDENKKKVSGNQEEQNDADESPLVSATSKEIIKKTSSNQLSGEDGDEASQRVENPTGEASDANERGTLLKEAKGEVEETQNSGAEGTIPLKDTNVNVDDKTLGMIAASEEKVNEKLENSEGSNEAPLKSGLNKSQEPDKYAEISRKTADPSEGGNDELGETKDVDEEIDDKLSLTKPNFDVSNGDLKTLKENDNSEVVSEEQKEKNFDEGEETRLETTTQTRKLDRETQNPDVDGINDTITKQRNPDDRSGPKREDKYTLPRASDGQDPENLKDETEENLSEKSGGKHAQDEKDMNRDASTDGILKATLEESDKENFDESDKEESPLHQKESEEKLKVTRENLKNKADDKAKEVEAISDDQTLESGDTGEEISLKAASNVQAIEGGLNINEEDDEAPLQVTLDDKKQEMMRHVDDDETNLKAANIDDDANGREGVENSDDNTLMKSLNEDDLLHPKDADETPLKTTFPDEDLVNEEAEENQNESKGIRDEVPLRVTTSKDDAESLVNVDETPLKATRNEDDEETLDDADEIPLRAVNVDNGLTNKETGNSNKAGEKVPNTDSVMEDDSAVGTDGQTFARAKNPEEAHRESGALDDESPLRAANFEEFNNNIHDGDETPLRATTDDLNHTESFESPDKDDGEPSLREKSISKDFSNQIDGQNEDETPLQSVESFHGRQEASEDEYETLRNEKPANDSEESEDPAVSTEDEFPLAAADPMEETKFQKNPKGEISSEDLQELHPRRNPLKKSALQVPTSIAKIMKDLEGQGKDDVTKIENLNPEKIDYIIDKIDEVEQQNKVTDEVDCRKECACAEDINTRSRNMGRYEIAKDFLQWMKDLQLNRVLSDD